MEHPGIGLRPRRSVSRWVTRRAWWWLLAPWVAGCGGGSDQGSGTTLSVTPGVVAFAGQEGVAPPAQVLRFAFKGSYAVASVEDGYPRAPWLTITGTPSGPSPASFQVRPEAWTHPGRYETTLRLSAVRADGVSDAFLLVPVSLQIQPDVFFVYPLTDPAWAILHADSGAAAANLPLTLLSGLSPGEGAACAWTSSSNRPWLTAVPASGDLSVAERTILAHLDAEQLWLLRTASDHATLTFQTGAGCAKSRTIQVPITLVLDATGSFYGSGLPSFTITPTSGAASFTRKVVLQSPFGGLWAAHAGWRLSSGKPWVTVSPSSGTGTTTVTLDLVPAELALLPTGIHYATITILPTDPLVPSSTFSVSLSLTR